MKAKMYRKKKLCSLLVLPFLAGTVTAKSALAADTVINPVGGSTLHVSGTNDSFRIFSYDEEVTVILDAGARINNDDSYPAVRLRADSTLELAPGAAISSVNASGDAIGVEFANAGSSDQAVNRVNLDQATIAATAGDGSAFGIYSGHDASEDSGEVLTRITLDNNSSITATASGSEYSQAVGIFLEGARTDSAVIELDHGSSISARATVTGGGDTDAVANATGIGSYEEVETTISLANGSEVSAAAAATGSGATRAETIGIAVMGFNDNGDAEATITLHNSRIGAEATATGADASAGTYGLVAVLGSSTPDSSNPVAANLTIGLSGSSVTATSTAVSTATDIYYGGARAEAVGIGAGALSDSENVDSSANLSITLTDSEVTALASSQGEHARAEATGILAFGGSYYYGSENSSIAITLDNSRVSAKADSGGRDSDAMAVGIRTTGAATLDIALLNGSEINVNATATGETASATAEGILARSVVVDLDDPSLAATADLNVALTGSRIVASATSTGTGTTTDGYSGWARAASVGIAAEAVDFSDKEGGATNISIALNNSEINADASATSDGHAFANAYGIVAQTAIVSDNSYGSTGANLNIDLAGSRVTATATSIDSGEVGDPGSLAPSPDLLGSRGITMAAGIIAEALTFSYNDSSPANISINLTDSEVSGEAIAIGAYASARAYGLLAETIAYDPGGTSTSAANITINLTDSRVTASADTIGSTYGESRATGISANADSFSDTNNSPAEISINLTGSEVIAEASLTTSAPGALALADDVPAGFPGSAKAVGISAEAGYQRDTPLAAPGQDAFPEDSEQLLDTSPAAVVLAINLTDSLVMASADTTGSFPGAFALPADTPDGYDTGTSATGINAQALIHPGDQESPVDISINLTHSMIIAEARFTGTPSVELPVAPLDGPDQYYGHATAIGINAEADLHPDSNYSPANISINLADSAVIADASTTTGSDGDAEAYGIRARIDTYAPDSDTPAATDLSVTLTDSLVMAIATAATTSDLDDSHGQTLAIGIDAHNEALPGSRVDTALTLNNSRVIADATATGGTESYAESYGLHALSGADNQSSAGPAVADLNIDLTGSLVAAFAGSTGSYYGEASAVGIGAETFLTAGSNDDGATISINLTDSRVYAYAAVSTTGGGGMARAYGIEARTEVDNPDSFSDTSAALNLAMTGSTITATAISDSLAMAVGIGAQMDPYSGNDLVSSHGVITLTDSQVSASAISQGEHGLAGAAGILAFGGAPGQGTTAITLNNSRVSATASNSATGADFYGGSIAYGLLTYGADTLTIDLLNGSSISATASGADGTFLGRQSGTGIGIRFADNATINIDSTSSVSGSGFAIVGTDSHLVVNNAGHIGGRLAINELNNSGTGTLQATLASDDLEWVDPNSETPLEGSYYFSVSHANLADGSTFRIKADNTLLRFTGAGQTREYRLFGTDTGGGDWDPAMINLVQAGYQSPLLHLSYDNLLSDSDHYILKIALVSPLAAGLSRNADNAFAAMISDDMLDLNTNPEEWSPEIQSRVFEAMAFLRATRANITNHLDGSGGTAAGHALWVEANYSSAEQDTSDRVEGFDVETRCMTFGYDAKLTPATTLGLGFSFGSGDADSTLAHRTQAMDDYLLSLYGHHQAERWFTEAQLTAGHGSIDSNRQVGSDVYSASFDTKSYYARVAGGLNFNRAGGWQISPQASLDYARIQFADYIESGSGGLALAVNPDDYDAANLGMGVKVERQGESLAPYLGAMLYYDMIGDAARTSSTFTGGTTHFETRGADPARTTWELSVGLAYQAPATPVTFRVGYDLLGTSDMTSNNFNGKLTYEF